MYGFVVTCNYSQSTGPRQDSAGGARGAAALVLLRSDTPLHRKLAPLDGTLTKIQVDECLVRNPGALRKRPKILDGGLVDTQRDLLLESPGVGFLRASEKSYSFSSRQPFRVLLLLSLGRAPSADQPNDGATLADAVASRQDAEIPSQANQDEAVLGV